MAQNDVIIFGVGQLASLAHFYFTHDSSYRVVAFTADRDFLTADTHEGLPVLPFEDIQIKFPPADYNMFLPISFKRMSHLRREKFEAAKSKGYHCISYVSSRATTWPGLQVGENCFIFEDNTIQPFVKIWNNCVLWSGNHIGHHTEIKDHVFITSQVVISGCCVIGEHSFFGVNSAVRDETIIGRETLVGMGAIITRDTPPESIWYGTKSSQQPGKSSDIKSISHKTGG